MARFLIALTSIIVFLNGCTSPLLRRDAKDAAPAQKQRQAEVKVDSDIIDEELYGGGFFSREVTRVAILLPLSGKSSKTGNTLLNAAQLALFDIRRSNIVLLPYDTKGTAFGAIEAANNAINDNAQIILGPLFSSSVKAVAKTANEHGVPVIAFSNNQNLMNRGAFLMGFMPQQQIERVVSYSMDQGKTSFSALVPNNHYGFTAAKILKEAVEKKDGHMIKTEFYFTNGRTLEKNVKRIINAYGIAQSAYDRYEEMKEEAKNNPAAFRALRKKFPGGKNGDGGNGDEVEFIVTEEDKIYPDSILIIEAGKRLSRIASLIKKYDLKRLDYQLIGSGQWDNISATNDENLAGGWFAAPNPKNYHRFERHYYSAYNAFPTRIATLAYDSLMVVNELARSKKRGQSFAPEMLTDYDGFSGVDGIFRFLPNGIVERQFSIIEINRGSFDVIDQAPREFTNY